MAGKPRVAEIRKNQTSALDPGQSRTNWLTQPWCEDAAQNCWEDGKPGGSLGLPANHEQPQKDIAGTLDVRESPFLA